MENYLFCHKQDGVFLIRPIHSIHIYFLFFRLLSKLKWQCQPRNKYKRKPLLLFKQPELENVISERKLTLFFI